MLTLAAAGLEVWLIVRIVELGQVSILSGVLAALDGAALLYFLRLFAKITEQTFAKKDLVPEENLRNYFRGKNSFISSFKAVNRANRDVFVCQLVRELLRFLEELLRSWVGPYHYELSVFSNRDFPEIVAYYETGGQTVPRSHVARQQDPEYYKKMKYEVAELLEHPSPEVIYIPETESHDMRYSFVDESQRMRIKSTVLHCLSVDVPRALVVVCDRRRTLREDIRLTTLIQAMGVAIESEYLLGDKIVVNRA